MKPDLLTNRTFDEIRVGDRAQVRRTLTVNDVKTFAILSGDINPTHVDEHYARDHSNGHLMAHSMWSGALISSLLGNELPGPGTRYVSQLLHFVRSVQAEETLTATITVREKRPPSRIVVFDCVCTLGDGDEVIATGTAEVEAPETKIAIARPDVGKISIQTYDKFERLVEYAGTLPPVTAAVAFPCSDAALEAAVEAARAGLIVPVLVGPSRRIAKLAATMGLDLTPYRIVEADDPHTAADTAVALVRGGEARVLIKGSLHTDELLAPVVRRDSGLRTTQRLSHAFLMDVPTYAKPLLVTDAAINIAPTLDEKRDICQNAIDLAHILGVLQPKVAVLSAMETINAKVASTTDAASLCKMAERGQIVGGILDGPLALDNAISALAARVKGIAGPVAGDADILLVPSLEAGNMLAKQLTFLANADAAGVVLGAKAPIILTSRADSVRARTTSCAVAVIAVAAHDQASAATLA